MGATMTATTSSRRLEQRLEALERANEIRTLRAQFKGELKVLTGPPRARASQARSPGAAFAGR